MMRTLIFAAAALALCSCDELASSQMNSIEDQVAADVVRQYEMLRE